MVFLIFLLLLTIFNGVTFNGSDSFNEDYLSKRCTTSINGIFVILVVFSHYSQYADLGGIYDDPYLALKAHLSQMVVASFLFYSGYGMMESIKKKGPSYINKIPTKFWQLLLRFDIAVLLFLVLGLALGNHFTVAQVLLSLTSWTAIGNSNWYITAILMIYIAMFISFKIGYLFSERIREVIGIGITLLLTLGCIYYQIKIGRPNYCYNTMILAPLGMLYSKYKYLLEKIIMRSDLSFALSTLVILAVYILSFFHRTDYGIEGYTVWAIAFMALLLLFTMKVRVYNELLEWFGTHIFSIYILQRIPMMILDHFGYIESHKYISLVVVFAVTIPLALIFEKVTNLIIKGITHGKRDK